LNRPDDDPERELDAVATLTPETDPVAMLDAPTAGGKVIRGSVLRVGGYVAGVLVGVVAASLMIRHLGVVDWGRYVTVTSLIAIVGGLSEAGLATIGAREYATRAGRDRELLLRNLLGLRLTIAVVGVVGALVFAVAAGYRTSLVVGTALAGVALLITVTQQMYTVPLGIALRIGLVSALDFARQVLLLVGVAILVGVGAGLLPFLALGVPISIVLLLLTVPLVRGTMPLRPGFDRAAWKEVIQVTVAYSAASAVASVYTSLTVILTSLLGTASELGFYGASFRVFSVLTALPLLVVGAAFPIVARAAGGNDDERLGYAMQRLFEVAIVFGSWMTLATVLGADFAIRVVAGDKFLPAVAVLQIQGAALIGTFVTVTWGTGLLALHRHRTLLVANLIGLGTSGVLTAALVPSYGAKGAAIATVGGELVLAAIYSLSILGADRRLRVELQVVPKAAVAAGAAVLLWIFSGLGGIALAAAGSVVYFVVLALLRGIPNELHEAFLRSDR
jgi:O-antigen/teichoic acid export membrane protein